MKKLYPLSLFFSFPNILILFMLKIYITYRCTKYKLNWIWRQYIISMIWTQYILVVILNPLVHEQHEQFASPSSSEKQSTEIPVFNFFFYFLFLHYFFFFSETESDPFFYLFLKYEKKIPIQQRLMLKIIVINKL